MTNQAIIIVDPAKDKDLLFCKINGKMFFHYQLSYLAENIFRKIVIVDTHNAAAIKAFFGSEYLGMKLEYIQREKDCSESSALQEAFESIEDLYALVLDAHHYFRLNLSKADDFRRMRDSKMLHIGMNSENLKYPDLPHLQLDEKGRIKKIQSGAEVKETDTFYSSSWLISKSYFYQAFQFSSNFITRYTH